MKTGYVGGSERRIIVAASIKAASFVSTEVAAASADDGDIGDPPAVGEAIFVLYIAFAWLRLCSVLLVVNCNCFCFDKKIFCVLYVFFF